MMKVDGACHCGAITVEGEIDPERVTICHCTDCQTSTGSAFRVSVPVAGKAFKMAGQPSIYVKTTAENGNPRINAFCPTCGSPIYSSAPGDDPPESYMLSASAFCGSVINSRRGGKSGFARPRPGSQTSAAFPKKRSRPAPRICGKKFALRNRAPIC